MYWNLAGNESAESAFSFGMAPGPPPSPTSQRAYSRRDSSYGGGVVRAFLLQLLRARRQEGLQGHLGDVWRQAFNS